MSEALTLADSPYLAFDDSPHLFLGQTVRLLAIFVDAWADHNWGVWETALLAEARSTGWTPTRTDRRLQEWGLSDRHGLFLAAGLTERQRQVMALRYPKDNHGPDPTPEEIAQQLGWPTIRVRVHLHEGYARLRAWAERQEAS